MNKSFISPFVLICMVTLLSCIIIAVFNEEWGYPIGERFVFFLIGAIISFGIGCLIISCVCDASNKEHERIEFQQKDYNFWIINYPARLINALSIVCFVAFLVMLFSKIGFEDGVTSTLRGVYLYKSSNDGGSGGNFVRNQIQTLGMAVAYMSVVAYFSKVMYANGGKRDVFILIPVALHIISTLIYTDRNILLRFAIYALVIFVLFYKNTTEKSKNKKNAEIMKKGIVAVTLIVIVFFLFGKLKQYQSGFIKSVSIYGGSGLYNYSYYLENIFNDKHLDYGKNTFLQFNNTLSFLGLKDAERITTLHGEGFIWGNNGYGSNIYSGLYNMTKDYGFKGVCVIMLLEGVWFEWIYTKTLSKGYKFGWIFYASMIYPVIYFPISDQLFGRMHLGLIYEVFWISIVYFILKNIRFRENNEII